jgi:hypothetical protein
VNLFKAWGVLPLLVELETAACPHKYRKDFFLPLMNYSTVLSRDREGAVIWRRVL